MLRLYFFLIFLSLVCCRKQLVDLGYINLEAERILNEEGYSWKIEESEKELEIYFEGNFPDERDDAVDDMEDAYRDIMNAFRIDEYEPVIHIFILENTRSMKRLVGQDNRLTILEPENILLLVQEYQLSEDDYEYALAKLIAIHLWGESAEWLVSGFATYASYQDDSDDLKGQAAEMLHKDELLFAKMLSEKTPRSKIERNQVAGSFVQFIIEEKGFSVLKSLWRMDQDVLSDKVADWKQEYLKSL